MMQEASPQLAASRPMGSARGMETAAARSSANRAPPPGLTGTGGGVYVVECVYVWERGPRSLSHDRSGPRARHTPGLSI